MNLLKENGGNPFLPLKSFHFLLKNTPNKETIALDFVENVKKLGQGKVSLLILSTLGLLAFYEIKPIEKSHRLLRSFLKKRNIKNKSFLYKSPYIMGFYLGLP